MTEPIAVTGSTGNLGGKVAAALADAGVEQRLLVRDPSRAPNLPGTEIATCSYDDGEAAFEALVGVSTLLMVSASEAPDRVEQHRTFIDAAARAGVQWIVYTSFLGAAPDATFTLGRDHFATEEFLRASDMTPIILRDNFYLDFVPMLAGEDGVIRGPAGDGRMAAVSRDDVAAVATAVLLDPAAHANQTYDLTGPDAFSLEQAASIITQLTEQPISFVNETIEEAYASRAKYGAPQWQLDAWVTTYTAIATGELDVVTDAVERLTGRPPMTLADLVRRNATVENLAI